MNYAEDRLDRKSRNSDQIFLEAHKHIKYDDISIQAKGHALAGRSMRDEGLMPQATFHYGMAWTLTCCVDKNDEREGDEGESENVVDIDIGSKSAKAAGDFAQVLELAGFPEVAVVFLLFHSLGGSLFSHEQKQEVFSSRDGTTYAGTRTEGKNRSSDYGLGYGKRPCFIPIQMTTSVLFQEIFNAFQSLENYLQNPSREEFYAADLLERVSKATQKKNPLRIRPEVPSHIPPQLQFWKNEIRSFGNLLQILLAKIMYSSPIGSSFLYLACESIRHLSVQLPLSSPQGRRMARTHKSHWAYYTLMYKVILGERVKKHRRGTAVPYHYPIWDIIHSLDQRKFPVDDNIHDSGMLKRQNDLHTSSLVQHLQDLFQKLSMNAFRDEETVPFAIPSCVPTNANSDGFIFAVGDSHVLSIGWQTLHIKSPAINIKRTIVPCPTTGLKAWHTRAETKFFTKYNLDCCLERLPKSCSTILLSAGEIDCREGIGGSLLEGYNNGCDDAVRNTVKVYVEAVTSLAKKYDLQILILPVAPHAYRSGKNGKALGRGLRRQRMLLWNKTLRYVCSREHCEVVKQHVFLLDYEEGLRIKNEESPVGFVLNHNFNADYTHMNSAFLPLLERSLKESGCDVNLL